MQMQATTTSASCKTYKVKIFAINPYSGSEAAVVVAQSVTMNSATSIKGTHTFKVTSGTSSWFVNEFLSSTDAVYLDPYSKTYPLSGTFSFTFKSYDEENGYPIYTVNLTNGTGVYNNSYFTGGMLDNIVDLPVKVYKNDNSTRITLTDYYKLTVNTNNASYGTVSGGGYYASGAAYTITATPKSGFRFVQWNDGNTNASRSVTLNSNLTYTATFEPNAAPQHTITVQTATPDYCTVSGGGTYYEGEEITISSVSKNEHLYIFDQFMLEEEDEDMTEPSFDITVTRNETYTAYYRLAYSGTITATASSALAGTATASPSGSLTGGTAVTLTAVANDGYTFTGWDDDNNGTIDNTDPTRTVYVDGNKTYAAQFVEGVTIDVQAALNTNHGFGWGYCFYYWAKAYGYDIMIRAMDNWSWAAGDNMTISEINASESFIKDHGTTVRFTSFDATCYNQGGKKVLEANAVGNNGKNYHLILRGVTQYQDDEDDAYNQTFTSSTPDTSEPGAGIFTGQNGSGDYYSVTWRNQLAFSVNSSLCGGVPTGIYQVDDSQADGTLIGDEYTYGKYSLNSTNLYYCLASGYAEVVNRDEQYYVYVDGYNSYGYDWKTTYGTAPYSVTVSGDANGTAGIVWHSNNCGDVVYGAGTQKFFSGNSITLTATPNSGYEFWRWSDESSTVVNSAYGASRNVTVSGNLTLQAIFRGAVTRHTVSITAPTNGTVTVSYNDGSEQSFTTGSRDIAEGTVLTVTTTPAADYHFGAWTNDGAASVTVNGDKTIGATFAQNDYFLNATYGAGGASVTRDDSGNSETVKRAGNTVTLTPNAAAGYEFLAWAGDDAAKMSGNVFTFPTNGTHNTTYNVQATFQAITYNLTYNGLEGATNSNPATYTIETATFALANPGTREGYTFTGWTCDEDAITQIAVGSTGDKTITANWSQNTYTVTIVSSNAEYGTVSPASVASVPYGTEITTSTNTINVNGTTVTATPTAATAEYTYTFDGWTNGTATVTGALTVTANFSRTTNSYTLTWVTDGDALTGDYTSGSTAYGTTIAQPANPTKTGYTFKAWTPDVAATMPAANTEYEATWDANTYTVTLNANGGNENKTTTATYDSNELTAWTAPTKAGNWTLNGYFTLADGGDMVITAGGALVTGVDGYTDAEGHWTRAEGSMTLYAQWTENITTYSVQFLAGAHGTVAATAGGSNISSGADVAEGTSVELTATAKNFYHFLEWQDGNGTQVSTTNPYITTLAGDLNLTAVFGRDEVIVLTDNHTADEAWYDDYAELVEDVTAADAKVTIRYERDMKANTWCVFALPFEYSLRSTSSVLKGKVYKLGEVLYTTSEGMTLNFPPVERKIEANVPYLFYSSSPASNLEFENVTLQHIGDGSYEVENSGDIANSSVVFHNTEAMTQLDAGKNEDAKKKTIYLSGNRLYYLSLNNASWMRAFRGYFELKTDEMRYIQPRVRIVLGGETATEIDLVDPDNSGNSGVRKYMENGILVIEREGVKYDATGAKIN